MGGYMPRLFQNLTGIDPYELLFNVHLGTAKLEERCLPVRRHASAVRLECAEDGVIKGNKFIQTLDAFSNRIVFSEFAALGQGEMIKTWADTWSVPDRGALGGIAAKISS